MAKRSDSNAQFWPYGEGGEGEPGLEVQERVTPKNIDNEPESGSGDFWRYFKVQWREKGLFRFPIAFVFLAFLVPLAGFVWNQYMWGALELSSFYFFSILTFVSLREGSDDNLLRTPKGDAGELVTPEDPARRRLFDRLIIGSFAFPGLAVGTTLAPLFPVSNGAPVDVVAGGFIASLYLLLQGFRLGTPLKSPRLRAPYTDLLVEGLGVVGLGFLLMANPFGTSALSLLHLGMSVVLMKLLVIPAVAGKFANQTALSEVLDEALTETLALPEVGVEGDSPEVYPAVLSD